MRAPLQPKHLRPRREKIFGHRPIPLDRNGKARVAVYMRALMRRTEPGKAYGELTAKALAVGMALLWAFHNAATGLCFPSYEAIAASADCARSTVYEAIHMLERAGVLTWANRIERQRVVEPDLFGRTAYRWRVVRTSNDYQFVDPKPPAKPPEASKSENPTGTKNQVSILMPAAVDNALAAALLKLGRYVNKGNPAPPDGRAMPNT
jgi:Helix-turn-helix domain